MAMAAANIGMMDGAYFVGRNDILTWINTTLQLNIAKVEEVWLGFTEIELNFILFYFLSEAIAEMSCIWGIFSISGLFIVFPTN